MSRVVIVSKKTPETVKAEPPPKPIKPEPPPTSVKSISKTEPILKPTSVSLPIIPREVVSIPIIPREAVSAPIIPREVDEEEGEVSPELPTLPPRVRKTKQCTQEDWKICCKQCCCKCPYFPICCNMPLLTALQLLIFLDMLIALATMAGWMYLLQQDPLQARVGTRTRLSLSNTNQSQAGRAGRTDDDENKYKIYTETSTTLGPPLFPHDIDADTEARRYRKIAYLNVQHQQKVEEKCGPEYYVEHLFGHQLNRTQNLLRSIILTTTLAEGFELFIDISYLITTCCFFSYTSSRVYLICIWHFELFPAAMKIWVFIVIWSQALCILQFGQGFHMLSELTVFHIIPLFAFRVYKFLVFSYFVHCLFTPRGLLTHYEKVQGMTINEYRDRYRQYLLMVRDRDDTSSDE